MCACDANVRCAGGLTTEAWVPHVVEQMSEVSGFLPHIPPVEPVVDFVVPQFVEQVVDEIADVEAAEAVK